MTSAFDMRLLAATSAPGGRDVLQFWGASWWDAAQALGTLAAVFLSVAIALREARRAARAEDERDEVRQRQAEADHRRVASLVSAWVETSYETSADGTHYTRRSHVFIANESSEPVFDVHVIVGAGHPPVQYGPLAVPVPLPVLPPRRLRSWDISLALLGLSRHEGEMPSEAVARIDFTDAKGVRWHRDFEGQLSDEVGAPGPLFSGDEAEGQEQLGDLSNGFNPMTVALAFHATLLDDESPLTLEKISPLLYPGATGWAKLDKDGLNSIQEQVANYGLAAHIWYPAPYVAYARLVHDDDSAQHVTNAGFVEVRAQLLTLCFVPGLGWRVFSLGGATAPNWIAFPEGSLTSDPRADVD